MKKLTEENIFQLIALEECLDKKYPCIVQLYDNQLKIIWKWHNKYDSITRAKGYYDQINNHLLGKLFENTTAEIWR